MIAKFSNSRIFSVLFIIVFLLAATPLQAARAAGECYVKWNAGGTNAGTSWTNAFTDLQSALGTSPCTEIWVAAGIYKPTTVGTDRNATFQLKSGVALYGGFAGTETARSERNPMAHLTILSGDIDNDDSQTPVITDLTSVIGNTTNSVHVVTGATGASLDGFTITAGYANGSSLSSHGGGMLNNGVSPTLTNVNFKGNFAGVGGGMSNPSGSSPILINVNFSRNSATNGGGMYNDSGTPSLTNVTISGNSATTYGGGMWNTWSTPTLTNVTIAGNSGGAGGGMAGYYSHATVRNTIFWGNTGIEIYNENGTDSVSDSVVQGGYPAGTNILTTDPLLGALGNYGGLSQTIPILAGSSAIDAGNNATCAASDERGMARVGTCDMGAFEYAGIDYISVRYAKPAASGSGDCSSWDNACTLQTALIGADFGYEIWTAAGTYKPTTDPANRNATFQLKSGVAPYGGFAGTETARNQRDPIANLTILSGDIDGNDSQTPIITNLTTVTGNTTNSFHVVTGAHNASLDGFTITAGYANGDSLASHGGGMLNNGVSPTLTNVNFKGNFAGVGGGMSNPSGSSPILINVNFSRNSATNGGGMYNDSGTPSLTNVTISGNSATTYGGGMWNTWSTPTLTNVTIAGNSGGAGGGMAGYYSHATVRNTIFWGNTGIEIYNENGTDSVSDSVVQGGYPAGTNILTTDPLLGALGNYGGLSQTIPILAGSSAIDAGNNATCAASDERGITRPQGAHCDMGAFEYAGIDYISVRYAKPAASGSGDCSSWDNACTLQTALTGADFGYEIWTAAGTYKPTTDPANRNATFQLNIGVALYGGFAGTETMRSQRNPMLNASILSGDIDSNDSQTPIITNPATVTGNTTNSFHVVTGAHNATLDGFTVTAGYSNYYGGGMYNNGVNPTLSNITFSGNSAAYGGGGVSNISSSSPTLTNITFSHNSAAGAGGGLYNSQSSATLTNATFVSNYAGGGGGMYNSESTATLTNITFAGNSGASGGIGTYDSSTTIRNTIFWGNTGVEIADDRGSAAIVSDSVVQGGYPGGTNILTNDPLLGALGNYGGFTQTVPLLAGSSAINTGNDTTCAATDQRGVARVGTCDMGAFEYAGTDYVNVRYAKPTASGSGDCSSWDNACILQTALTGAEFGDEIWTAAGTYKPTTDPANRNATFQLKNGVALYGGFAGTETERNQRSPMLNTTILSGDIDGNDSQTPILTDLATVTGNTTNSYHVVTGVTGATLDGFTITAGYANGGGELNYGGGMYNNGAGPTLRNLTFNGNSTVGSGGGVSNSNGSSPTLTNVNFNHNSAAGAGGGLYNSQGSSTLTNVTFISNSASGGAGMYNSESTATLINVTFAGNSGASGGIGTYDSSTTIRNTIFWGNTGVEIADDRGSAAIVSDSVVQGGYPGGTNILTTDPLLGALGNYGGLSQTIPVLAGSSAIDAGDNATCATSDERGTARPQGAHCDMGAFEYAGIDYVNVRYAKPAASGSSDCSSWDNACTLQTALTGADFGYEIWTTAGTYKPGTLRTDTFQLKTGVELYGGFDGTETLRSQRNPMLNATILSGDIDGNDSQTPIITNPTTVTGNTTNSYHVVTGANNATLDGFTITAGYSNYYGGGMYNNGVNPTLSNITFSGNSADYGGGGVSNISSSSPTLMNITFSHNSAAGAGGGLYNSQSSSTLSNATFVSNYAGGGGGMYNSESTATLTNVTFAGNSGASGGIGTYDSSTTIRNTIFWGNTGVEIADDRGSAAIVSDSVVQGGYASGTNIIADDPLLGALGNYGGFTLTIPLLAGSSAINTGNDTTCAATDQRGITRPQGMHCDIGAFEQDDFTAPTVETFIAPSHSNSFDIPITAFTATDAVGVTGYLITESAPVPTADVAGWTAFAPTTYTVLSEGSYSLYPWAKDAAGNVSAVFSSPRTVVVDTTKPVVTTFTVTSPSNSLNIPISAFSATDTVGVTGYLITESASVPTAGAGGWTAAAPTTYTVLSEGSYSLYPWAKDAAGNVSAVFSSPRTVVVDTTKPVVTTFTVTSPSNSLNIPISAFSATDTVGVTGFKVTISATPPAPGSAGWTATAPTTYTVASDGSYTLYPWAKDAAGNVSAVFASPRAVIVDTTKPTVATFTITTPSNSLNIPITAFTATDAVGVTGYMITDSSTPPVVGAAGWTATAPTTYTVASDGSYTLYPWALDAAGNVSAAFSSPRTVVVDTTYSIYLPLIMH